MSLMIAGSCIELIMMRGVKAGGNFGNFGNYFLSNLVSLERVSLFEVESVLNLQQLKQEIVKNFADWLSAKMERGVYGSHFVNYFVNYFVDYFDYN